MPADHHTSPAATTRAPRQVAVVGAGIAGLATTLLLARDGHRITLIERDRLDRGDEVAGLGLLRTGTPQARHSHAFLGRLRKLLATDLPDLLAALHAAGASDYPLAEDLPDTITDRSPMAGDEDLVLLACRRTTFEAVLRKAALAEPGVTLRDGTAVEGLRLCTTTDADDSSGLPTVAGLRLRTPAGPEELAADLVVLTGGPRAPIPDWLGAVGVTIPETSQESGVVYFSRFFEPRTPDVTGSSSVNESQASGGGNGTGSGSSGSASPGPGSRGATLGLLGADIGYLKCAVFRGDNNTFSVTLAPRASDEELRTALRDPDAFLRACAQFEPIAPWVAADAATPASDVFLMARLGNHRRRFLDDSGRPRVLGLHAVGDAHTATNPLYGRGCTMAFVQASLLARALRDHPVDDAARARAYEAATEEHIGPWYDLSVAQDQFSRRLEERSKARRRAAARGDRYSIATASSPDSQHGRHLYRPQPPDPAEEDVDGSEMMGKILREGLFPASRTDPVVARAFLRVVNALQTPTSLMGDTEVINRVLATMANPEAVQGLPNYSVRRVDLLEAVGAA